MGALQRRTDSTYKWPGSGGWVTAYDDAPALEVTEAGLAALAEAEAVEPDIDAERIAAE
ncbi:MAG: hypothetical protein RL145_239 [Pseudomonadota bacterium]|jgi:hypothetical protein